MHIVECYEDAKATGPSDTRARDALRALVADGPPTTTRDRYYMDCAYCKYPTRSSNVNQHTPDCPWLAAERILKELEEEDET